jgi:hypothetical protein
MTDKEFKAVNLEYNYTLGYIKLLKLNVKTQESKAMKLHYEIDGELLNRYNTKAKEDRYYSRLLNLCHTGR